ncbi:MAG: sulfatase [Candidatus Wallbacteria bacterium]|nr:sulfatase [Candidatus Wallbacteria bacterium]
MRWALAWLAIVGATACGVPRQRPDIVLVTLDAARADHFSSYGCRRLTTPRLDRLAAGGALFEDAYAHSDWTLASLGSLVTSRYPARHGAVTPLWILKPDVPTLAQVLGDAGYVTAAFTASYFHDEKHGLGRGFATYESVEPASSDPQELTARALRWMASNTKRPFFLWVHYFDPHAPYLARQPWYGKFHPGRYEGKLDFSSSMDPNTVVAPGVAISEADQAHLNALYDSEVAYTDQAIGGLLEAFTASTTLVCVTSDHGEELKERGNIGHGLNLNRELIHVPLILAGPGIDTVGVRVRRTVQQIDVMPTLLELAGVGHDGKMDGRSLTGLLGGAERTDDAVAYAEQMESSDFLSVYSLVRQPWHLILQYARQDGSLRGIQLFDMERDPTEQKSLWDEKNAEHASLKRQLEAYVKTMGGPKPPAPAVAPANPERMKELKSLGYLR